MQSRLLSSRRSRWLATGAIALATVLLVIFGLLPSLASDPRPLRVGFANNAVAQDVATPGEAAQLISGAGARIDRVQVEWATLEPAPGRYRFGRYDAIYRADLARGLRPLFILAYAPNWAGNGACDGRISSCHMGPGPGHFRDFARTAALLARRYPRLAGIEIWNEPNTPYFWAPRADPRAYAALLKRSFKAINRVAPTMPVAGGSMASSPGIDPGSLTAPDFLRAVYASGGGNSMDALSIHPYPDPGDTTVQSALDRLREVREVRDDRGYRATPLWVTETGISTTGPGAVPPEVQAYVLLRLYDVLRRQRGVKMVLIHTLVEPSRSLLDPELGYGVLTSDHTPKPAYCTLSSAWAGKASC